MKDKLMPVVVMLIGAAVIFFAGVQHGSNIKVLDMVDVYDAGKKEALRISPRPSMELEMTCVNIWAGKVAPPAVLQ